MDKQKFFEEIRGIRRIVINDCYGGFGLSVQALKLYKEKASITTDINYYEIDRDDPYLVKVVKELGSYVNGPSSNLKIVEVPADVDWIIQEYDGLEWVAERHRTWK